MDKVIIYLDQNFISDIAKLSLEERKAKVNPLLGELYEEIKAGVDEEKFLSPDSWIHAIETASESDRELQERIQGHQGYLGQVSLQSETHIKNHQFAYALLSFCGKEAPLQNTWKVAFHENPNKRLENINVKVRWNSDFYKKLHTIPTDELLDIKNDVKDENSQFLAEIEAARKHYKGILSNEFNSLLQTHGIEIEKAKSFISSDQFCEIPNLDIFCKMWSKNFTFQRKKEQLTHDFNDISFLSAFMPYCDVIATDKHMKNLACSLKLDKKYDCHIFSLTEKDLHEMKTLLSQLRKDTVPANQSLFSVVCIKPSDRQMYSVEFLQMLNGTRNKFERTGKYWNQEVYTSVFLTFSENDNTEPPEPVNGYWQLSQDQWADMLIFGQNFKRLTINSSLENTVSEIPSHLRGSGTAIIDSESVYQASDSLDQLFYDIESAIEQNLSVSKKFKTRIIYQ